MVNMRILHFPPQRLQVLTPGDHPSASEVAAFVDRLLPDADRDRIERHLADCAPCRDELAASTRLARSAPLRRPRGIFVFGVGIAAAAALVLVVRAVPRSAPVDSVVERGLGPGVGEIMVVSPRPGSTIAGEEIHFVWRADLGAAGYKVIVTTAAGTQVWSHEVSDTTVTPPREATFFPGEEFYWRVESSRVNGGTATSRTESFRVAAR
jgi:hypothetical protein